MSKKSVKEPSWKIIRIKGSPAAELGTVEAPDADAAIKKAIKLYEIPVQQQSRLAARRIA